MKDPLPPKAEKPSLRKEIEKIVLEHGHYHYNQGEPEEWCDRNTGEKLLALINRERKAAVVDFIDRYNSEDLHPTNLIHPDPGDDVLAAMFPTP